MENELQGGEMPALLVDPQAPSASLSAYKTLPPDPPFVPPPAARSPLCWHKSLHRQVVNQLAELI